MTTQQELTHKKYQQVLERLWRALNTRGDINMQNFISKEKVSTNLWTVLSNQEIIVKTSTGYKWNKGFPESILVSEVIEGIRNYKSTKKDKNKCRVTSEKTVLKYKESLNHLYFLLQYTSDISMEKFCSEKQIGKSLPGVLQNLEVVKYESGKWIWIGNKPDEKMIDDIFEFRKRAKEDQESKNPFTVKEQKIVDLLTEAHNKYVELKEMHPDDIIEWKNAIHQCQNCLKNRVLIRDYPDVFYKK